MMLLVDKLRSFSGDVGIDLRRRKIAVSQQQLHHA